MFLLRAICHYCILECSSLEVHLDIGLERSPSICNARVLGLQMPHRHAASEMIQTWYPHKCAVAHHVFTMSTISFLCNISREPSRAARTCLCKTLERAAKTFKNYRAALGDSGVRSPGWRMTMETARCVMLRRNGSFRRPRWSLQGCSSVPSPSPLTSCPWCAFL